MYYREYAIPEGSVGGAVGERGNWRRRIWVVVNEELFRDRVVNTHLRPMRSTYGCEPPLLASTPSFFFSSYSPRETPLEIAFISVYTEADGVMTGEKEREETPR